MSPRIPDDLAHIAAHLSPEVLAFMDLDPASVGPWFADLMAAPQPYVPPAGDDEDDLGGAPDSGWGVQVR